MTRAALFFACALCVCSVAGCLFQDGIGFDLGPGTPGPPSTSVAASKQLTLRLEPETAPQRFHIPLELGGDIFGGSADISVDNASDVFGALIGDKEVETRDAANYLPVVGSDVVSTDFVDRDGFDVNNGVEVGFAAIGGATAAIDVDVTINVTVFGGGADTTVTLGRLEPHHP